MIKTFIGPMFSGKSEALISIYNSIWDEDKLIAFKPLCDTRDGMFIKSKNSDEVIPAIGITNLEEIKDIVISNSKKYVFIDEAEFLEGDVSVLLDLAINYDVDIYIAGLNLTSEQKTFGIMGDILAISHEIVLIKGKCQECWEDSFYSYYEGSDKTGDVLVGDDNYIALCPKCLKNKKQKILIKGGYNGKR